YHVLEVVPLAGVGAGDVGTVAVETCARIDQERAGFRRRTALLVLVVQDRGVLVERDDVAVRHLVLVVRGGPQVGEMDVELARPVAEGALGGKVGARAGEGGFT